MHAPNLTTCVRTFVRTLIKMGVEDVVLSPGSRNFPLLSAFVELSARVKLHTIVDERSAGFVALGLYQATGKPVVVCCTSGTAVLNFYPAVAEAYYAGAELIVLTADRPPESIDNWEGQCIRQDEVFANHIRASYATPDAYNNPHVFGSIASEAYRAAVRSHGPVHVNMPFREPFYGEEESEGDDISIEFAENRIEAEPVSEEMMNELRSAKRILWLNGASLPVKKMTTVKHVPVFSDIISNQTSTIEHWEAILLTAGKDLDKLYPDLIITTGQYFVSKHLRTWLREVPGLRHWHLGNGTSIPKPFGTNPKVMSCDPDEVMSVIGTDNMAYAHLWNAMENRFISKFEALDWGSFTEFSVIRNLSNRLNEGASIQVSNSMPVRYLGYLGTQPGITYYANRGTSGIDGCTSTAAGFARAVSNEVFLFTGDVAFFYDVNGLWADKLPQNLKIILLNNSGGGIFELIDGPMNHQSSLNYQVTPHNRTAKHICEDYGIKYFHVTDWDEYEKAVKLFLNHSGIAVFEIQTQRPMNRDFFEIFKQIKLS